MKALMKPRFLDFSSNLLVQLWQRHGQEQGNCSHWEITENHSGPASCPQTIASNKHRATPEQLLPRSTVQFQSQWEAGSSGSHLHEVPTPSRPWGWAHSSAPAAPWPPPDKGVYVLAIKTLHVLPHHTPCQSSPWAKCASSKKPAQPSPSREETQRAPVMPVSLTSSHMRHTAILGCMVDLSAKHYHGSFMTLDLVTPFQQSGPRKALDTWIG